MATAALIDLHCHILPALDDGAVDLEDSIAMARRAERDGIATICATPHVRADHPVAIDELGARVDDLNRELGRQGLATRVVTGAEIAASKVEELADAELAATSLGGGGAWILLEPLPGPLTEAFSQTVADLRARGFSTVVAHPERHLGPAAHRHLADAVRLGAVVQVTAAFVLEEATAPAVLGLAECGLAHVLGSDAHSSRWGRPVALSRALDHLRTVPLLAPHLDWIAHVAPAAIVGGQSLMPPWGDAT